MRALKNVMHGSKLQVGWTAEVGLSFHSSVSLPSQMNRKSRVLYLSHF